MKISTLDLYSASLCSTKWSIEGYKREAGNPIREALRELVIYSGRRNVKRIWDIKDISMFWDKIFWRNKNKTDDKLYVESINGLLKLKKFFEKLPEEYVGDSSNKLSTVIDSTTVIYSSSDFVISTKDEISLWIYTDIALERLKKSILPAAERYVLNQSLIGGTRNKKISITKFYISKEENRVQVEKFFCKENNPAVRNLATSLSKKIYYPTHGKGCIDCSIKCWLVNEEE